MNLIPIQLRHGLRQTQLQHAAQLYFDAFRRQISPILGADNRAVALLRQLINPKSVLTACQDGQIIGLAGLQYNSQRFIQPQLPLFISRFGWILGRIRYRQAALLEQPCPPDQLYISGIAVSPEWRGQGIGTWLLNAAVDFASKHGLEAVHIQVPNTAPALKQLCQRLGFINTATQNRPYLKLFGINQFNTFSKNV
jgi:ribosomal protein S18 acetylase RimI-like enzyme